MRLTLCIRRLIRSCSALQEVMHVEFDLNLFFRSNLNYLALTI